MLFLPRIILSQWPANKGIKQTSNSLASSLVLPGMHLNREQARLLQLIVRWPKKMTAS